MPTEVASTEYGVILHHDEWNTLELKWLPATKDATEAAARDTMALFAAQTEKRKPQFLIVDTTDPGFSWTPIITHDGAHHTNATYYSDVRVPVTMRVGEENAGWQLVTAQLNHERVMLGPAGRIAALYDRVCGWRRPNPACWPSPTSGGRWRGPTPACGSTSCSTGRWRRRPRWRSRTRP